MTLLIPKQSHPISGSYLLDVLWWKFLDQLANASNASDPQAAIDAAVVELATALGSPDGTIANIPAPLGSVIFDGQGGIRIFGSLADGLLSVEATASNGLTPNAYEDGGIKLGGALTEDTAITLPDKSLKLDGTRASGTLTDESQFYVSFDSSLDPGVNELFFSAVSQDSAGAGKSNEAFIDVYSGVDGDPAASNAQLSTNGNDGTVSFVSTVSVNNGLVTLGADYSDSGIPANDHSAKIEVIADATQALLRATGNFQVAGTVQADGTFDAGTTAPAHTTRINYDGHFYAKKFLGDGSALTGITPVGSPLTSAYMWVGSGTNVAAAVLMSGDGAISNAGVFTLTAAQPAAHTWALTQTFTVAPVFTDASGARTALGLAIGTNVQAYDADLTTWAGITPGTGVGTALAVNVGTAGAFVVKDGALGTPSSGTLTNCTFPTLNQNTSGSAASAGIPLNSQSTSYTCVLGDANGCIYHPAADTTARTFTIPANGSVAYAIGTAITFDNDIGAGALTIAITTDTLVLVGAAGSTGSRTLATGGQATAIKVTATRWRINGTLLT